MTLAAVIFDCDGVVVDTEGPSFALLGQDLARYGWPLTQQQMQEMFLGGTVQGIFDICRARGVPLPNDWVEDFYARIYDILAKSTPLMPGILSVLSVLEHERIGFAIGSNGSARKMQITLGQHSGLIERFQGHIYSSQTLGKPKPAPDLYLHCAAALKVAPADCVVIEDSPTGALAAKAAGMRCFGYAPHGNADLATAGAIIFGDMNELPKLLGL